MLISPTEPPSLRAMGIVSSVPEQYGSDVLFPSRAYGTVGIQRKEISDLVSSCANGRLAYEVAKMKGLGLGLLLVEGVMAWSSDGLLISKSRFTRAQYLGLLWKMNLDGFWTARTSSLAESIEYVSMFGKWCQKDRHSSLAQRPGPKSSWGTVDNRDWGVHILQGFDGMGPERAGILYDRYGVPLVWSIGKREMGSLPKFGKKTVDRLFANLGQMDVDAELSEEMYG